jgi:hypothetical protein
MDRYRITFGRQLCFHALLKYKASFCSFSLAKLLVTKLMDLRVLCETSLPLYNIYIQVYGLSWQYSGQRSVPTEEIMCTHKHPVSRVKLLNGSSRYHKHRISKLEARRDF